MNWRIKGIVQKTLSTAPGGMLVNDVLQRTVGGLRNVEAAVDSKVVDDWIVLAGQLRDLNVRLPGAVLGEVGTGWVPVLPLCFAIAGARACHTFDVTRHLDTRLTSRAIARLSVHLPRIATAVGIGVDQVQARYEHVSAAPDVETALERAGVHYHAPADAAQTGLADRSIDAVFSNSVLEHVPSDGIAAILRESTRILKPDGVSLHSVNCGDHYAYFDRSVTPLNYLRYSSREWRLWNNRLLYQNRLRPADFLRLAETAGLQVTLSRFTPKEALLKTLPTLGIAEEFRRYAPDQLCTTSIDFAGRPAH
jgi:SAM-dependent methyltransferase